MRRGSEKVFISLFASLPLPCVLLYVSEWIKLHVNSIIIPAIIPFVIYHTLANNLQPSTDSFSAAAFRMASASCRVNGTECLCWNRRLVLVVANERNPTQTGLLFTSLARRRILQSFIAWKLFNFFSLTRFFLATDNRSEGEKWEDNESQNKCDMYGVVVFVCCALVCWAIHGTKQQLKAKTKAAKDIDMTATNVPFTCLIYFLQLRKWHDTKSCHRRWCQPGSMSWKGI